MMNGYNNNNNDSYYQQSRNGSDPPYVDVVGSLPFMNYAQPPPPQPAMTGAYMGYQSGYPQANYYQQPMNYAPQQPPPAAMTNMPSNYYPQPLVMGAASVGVMPSPMLTPTPAQTQTPTPTPTTTTTPSQPEAPRTRQLVFKNYKSTSTAAGTSMTPGTTSSSSGLLSGSDMGKKSLRLQPIDNAFLTRPKWKFNYNQLWCYEVSYLLLITNHLAILYRYQIVIK
eukprot:TRINITY_DN472_c0_g1_i2.p1 TRINITY_DN472_c0_g1~~TRINITY_DN472_c0_g1_i2.p1  ORF type:complete len:225 (-),score=50.91 TRINITY_DN472_c0_g1_i2:1386-2060(-)